MEILIDLLIIYYLDSRVGYLAYVCMYSKHKELQKPGTTYTNHNYCTCMTKTIFSIPLRSYRSPCVIFCDHPSARLGPLVHLLHSLREGTKNTLIITEPDYTELRLLLAPFQPLYMLKVFHYPVDNRLTFQEANALLYELSPRRVLAPRDYLESGTIDGRAGPTGGADEKLAEYAHTLIPSRPNMKLTGCARRQVFTFYLDAPEDGVEEGGDLVEIDPNLAAEVQPISLDQGTGSLVVLNACLVSHNGKRRLVYPNNDDVKRSGNLFSPLPLHY